MSEIVIAELTSGTVDGSGVFDTLMKAAKAHLEQEFGKNRIKGAEYATVYLGSIEASLRIALEFTLQHQRAGLEADLISKQIEKATADIALVHEQTANAVLEGKVLVAQECKLRAEYDHILAQTTKAATENSLLAQKIVTEKAQTQSIGVDDGSVIGKQKALYQAQTEGFTRDAEQKVTKILVDTWNARRMTDEGTVADGVNLLNDASLGRAVGKLLAGINA